MDSMRQRAKGLPSSACLNRLCFPLLSLRPRSQFPIMVIREIAEPIHGRPGSRMRCYDGDYGDSAMPQERPTPQAVLSGDLTGPGWEDFPQPFGGG